MSLSARILTGLVLGVATGIFFGEDVAFLHLLGNAFIQLLQMTVLPYVTVSLILGLGRLGFREATSLAWRAGGVLLLLWAITIALVLAMPVAFPDWKAGSFFSTTLVQDPPDFDFVELYIPSNPFHALANNVVPAVVLFSVAIGVALIGVERKTVFIEALSTFSSALTRVTDFVVALTPIGVFAIAASAAGTLSLEEVRRLQVFLATYVSVALLMTFWILPGLVTALTPLRYRDVVGLTKDALVTAFATASLFIVLPVLAERSREMLSRVAPDDEELRSLVDVVVPASFSFPSSAKLLSLSFMLFAAWYSGTSLSTAQYPTLVLTGVVTFFGSLNSALPFMLDLLRIPVDMFQLFVATSVVNARFGTLLAAMHTLALALLGACAMRGLLRVRAGALLRYLVVSAILLVATLGGARLIFARAMAGAEGGEQILARMRPILGEVQATVHRTEVSAPEEDLAKPVLERVRARGTLRVGYREGFMPLSFTNPAGELVGFDIEMAGALARDLGVALELVPLDPTPAVVAAQVNSGYCDVAMPGIAVTAETASALAFSEPYLDLTLAFAVRDHRRDEFNSRAAIQRLEHPRIGVPPVRYYTEMLRRYLPDAELVSVRSPADFTRTW
jgi:Na+/H+-dicarboxylate symporter/ABC-type amino acid transport substrate-binding protein